MSAVNFLGEWQLVNKPTLGKTGYSFPQLVDFATKYDEFIASQVVAKEIAVKPESKIKVCIAKVWNSVKVRVVNAFGLKHSFSWAVRKMKKGAVVVISDGTKFYMKTDNNIYVVNPDNTSIGKLGNPKLFSSEFWYLTEELIPIK
jgi:hypothetical protein